MMVSQSRVNARTCTRDQSSASLYKVKSYAYLGSIVCENFHSLAAASISKGEWGNDGNRTPQKLVSGANEWPMSGVDCY